MKKFIKKNYPGWLALLKKIHHLIFSRKVVNYFHTAYAKNALLSYATYPFTGKPSLGHTTYFLAMSHANVLNELGYNVDIVPYEYEKKVDFSKYEVLIGFGDVFQKYFESGLDHMKTIFYGTGMHGYHQNHATIKRIKDVYGKKKIWLCESARFLEKTGTHQTLLVDAMILLGNHVCRDSYAVFYDGPIYGTPNPFYKILDGDEMSLQRRKRCGKGFLWFGGSGLIHKGLDLVLEVFAKHPELKLYVCGPIKNEPDFERAYFKELYQTENIISCGFVDISSHKFKEVLQDCAFIISPSCAEAGCASVVTAIGNGALIPVITKETTLSTGSEILIMDFTPKAVEEAVSKAAALNEKQILEMQKLNLEYVLKHHSQENYYKELKKAVCEILSKK